MVKALTIIEEQVSEKSHISEVQFRRVLKCFSVDNPATSAAVLVGLNRKTTQRIYSLLRDRIEVNGGQGSFSPLLSKVGDETDSLFRDGAIYRTAVAPDLSAPYAAG